MNNSELLIRRRSAPAPLDWAGNSTANYYQPGVPAAVIAAALGVQIERLSLIGRQESAALYVILTWAMRAMEYLSLTTENILPGDRVFVRGLKRSQSYLISLPGVTDQFRTTNNALPGRLAGGASYQRIYRACVRISHGVRPSGHVNFARAHSGRYALAGLVLAMGNRSVSDVLHHRSETSAGYYTGAERSVYGYH